MERTLCLLKPETVESGIVGAIITRLENTGFKIVAMKLLMPTIEQARTHYQEHEGKHFFDRLTERLTRGPIVALVLEREDAVKNLCAQMGPFQLEQHIRGTIREQYAKDPMDNVIHGTAEAEQVLHETAVWFPERPACTTCRFSLSQEKIPIQSRGN